MAISLGQTGTADSVDAEYFNWESSDRRFLIHMHLDAIDGLARDVTESSAGLPVEVGGLLLGQVGRGDRPVVWVERYQRVSIDHRSGPDFVLDDTDHATFEQAARRFSEDNELSVIGYYRSHLRPGFQLEDPDRELAGRYFGDREDLVLLLKPDKTAGIQAEFFGRAPESDDFQALGPAFPFRGRAVVAPEPEKEPTVRTRPVPPPAVAHRRLVPDFQPAPEPGKAAREFFMETRPAPPRTEENTGSAAGDSFFRRRWPLIAAILLVGSAIAVMIEQATKPGNPQKAAPVAATSVRPLGLYVDPSGQSWRISWNPSATALQSARQVRLFIHDGDDRTPVDISKQDLQSGTYQYSPNGRDVTFRLEVTDKSGAVTAESFRMMAQAAAPPAAVPASAAARDSGHERFTPPSASHKVAPVVPASIRPRIKSPIPLDVRVRVDAHGRVVSAVPVRKPAAGLESYLSTRAVYAARQWRFEPARENGKAVPGTEIIHFVFDK